MKSLSPQTPAPAPASLPIPAVRTPAPRPVASLPVEPALQQVVPGEGRALEPQVQSRVEARLGHALERMRVAPATGGADLRVGAKDDACEHEARQLAAPQSRSPAPTESANRSQGFDFSRVRIHADARAARSAQGLAAQAYTAGRHIVFGAGRYRPESRAGEDLLVHELAHVAQQRAASLPTLIQREGETKTDEKKGTNPPAQAPAGQQLTFVLKAPDDGFTQDVKDYASNTLKDPSIIEVDNLDQVFDHLNAIKSAKGPKVTGIRIIGHGSTTGGIKMTPKGETDRRFVTAQELAKMAEDKNLQATASAVMAPGSSVEFWGCNIGATEQTTQAMSTLFQSEFKSTSDTLKAGYDEFLRRADKGEKGDTTVTVGKGKSARQVAVKRATSTVEIDARAKDNPNLKTDFDNWLVARHAELQADGDAPPQASRDDTIKYMRDLFDRSGGRIKHLKISSGSGEVRKSDKQKWMDRWKTVPIGGSGVTP